MRKASGGQLIVQSLLTERISRVFTVPGESFLAVLDALYDTSDSIDVVTTRHEEGAGFMADSYAKASGEVGVCMVTRGVGVTNLSIALHTARQDSTPMLALVGQIPTQVRYREAFQEVDLARFLSPIVKWAIEIPSAERVPELMQQAFRVARSERPGPVVVGLPEDVLAGVVTAAAERPRIVIDTPRPDAEAVAGAYDAIRSASWPVVIAGREVLTTGSSGELVKVSEQLALPVMTAFRRFDAFPNDHQNYVGNIALGTPKAALKPLEEADLVIGLGTRFTEVTTNGYDYPKPETPIIHVAASTEIAGVWGAKVTPIVAGVDKFLADFGVHAGQRLLGAKEIVAKRQENIRRYREVYERLSGFDEPVTDSDLTSISQVVESISSKAPRNSAVTTDAGNFSAWVSRYYPFVEPKTHFAPISGAMGYGLPGAIGASFADRERLVFAFAGDGGFAMTMSELAVVAEHKLKVVSLVFVNGQYGTIRMHQQKHFPDRRVATSLHNPSFVEIGRAFGLDSFRVSNNAEFDQVLDDVMATPRPALIEIMQGRERLTAWGNFSG